ncbi:MAG: hypothetical protein ACMUJM_21135 [bacterium]
MFRARNSILLMCAMLLALIFMFPMNGNAQWGFYPYTYSGYYNPYFSYGYYNPSTFTSSFYTAFLKYFRDPYAPYLNPFLGYYSNPSPAFYNPYYSYYYPYIYY